MSQLRTLERIADVLIRMNDENILGSQLVAETWSIAQAERELEHIENALKTLKHSSSIVDSVARHFYPVDTDRAQKRLQILIDYAESIITQNNDTAGHWQKIRLRANNAKTRI